MLKEEKEYYLKVLASLFELQIKEGIEFLDDILFKIIEKKKLNIYEKNCIDRFINIYLDRIN